MDGLIFLNNKSRKLAEEYYFSVLGGENIVSSQDEVDKLFYVISTKPFDVENNLFVLTSVCEKFEEYEIYREFYTYSISHWESREKDIEFLYGKVTSIEILQYFMDMLYDLKYKNKGYDSVVVDDYISSSMFSEMESTYKCILRGIYRYGKPGEPKKNISKRNSYCRKLVKKTAYQKVIGYQLREVFRNSYVPCYFSSVFGECSGPNRKPEFYLCTVDEKWMRKELYRDLRITNENRDRLYSTAYDVAKRYFESEDFRDGPVFRVDMEAVEHDVKSLVEEEKIKDIYDTYNSHFYFKGSRYPVKIILQIMVRVVYSNGSSLVDKSDGLIRYNEDDFIRVFKIFDSKLIELFVYDLNDGSGVLKEYSPCFRLDGYYYIAPITLDFINVGKCIDQILSHSDVKLDQNGDANKGTHFERYLSKVLGSYGYDVKYTNKSEKNRVPEIDGLFLLGKEYLVVYEAKSSVNVEGRHEVFRFMDNHVSKALEQLDKAIDFIENDPDGLRLRTGLNLSGRKVIPLIVSNINYFSGSEVRTKNNRTVHFVDSNLLLSVLCDSRISEWNKVGYDNDYSSREVILATEHRKINALQDPSQFMKSLHGSRVQVLDHGVAFTMAREFNVV